MTTASPPPVHAVITGNIRSFAELQLVLARTCHLRATGQLAGVVLSTWRGEVDRFPTLRARLADIGVTLVEDDPPGDPGMGHIAVQQRSLWNGLQECPDDAFVLKLRTDKISNELFSMVPQMMSLIPRAIAPRSDSGTLPEIFQGRLITSSGAGWPFHIQDIVFAGWNADIRRKLGFGRIYEGFRAGHTISAEERWFGHPFLGIPVFWDYFYQINILNIVKGMRIALGRTDELGPLPTFIRKLVLTWHLMFPHCFIACQVPDFSDVDEQGRARPLDQVIARVLDHFTNELGRGAWAAGFDRSALREEAEAIVAGDWRRPVLDRAALEELQEFQARIPGLGPIVEATDLTTPPPVVPGDLAAGRVAQALSGVGSSGQDHAAIPITWLERIAAGESIQFGQVALDIARDHWRAGRDDEARRAALTWLRIAAQNGIARAELLLALAHLHGIVVAQDAQQAGMFAARAAARISRSQRAPRIAVRAIESLGMNDFARAFIFEPLSHGGNPHGWFLVGEIHAAGTLVEQDLATARHFFERAAAQGHRESIRRLEALAPRRSLLTRLLDWIR